MARKLRLKLCTRPSITIHRAAFTDEKLVYVARANRTFRYPWGRSRIGYIGTTRRGARRIASSAAQRGATLLEGHGIKTLDFHIVTCTRVAGLNSWRKLERMLLLRFRELFGAIPVANRSGRRMKRNGDERYFRESILDSVIRRLS